jgi:hypothetical protein
MWLPQSDTIRLKVYSPPGRGLRAHAVLGIVQFKARERTSGAKLTYGRIGAFWMNTKGGSTMSDRLPGIVGLKELLALKKPLRERPAPLVYFTEAEFKRSIKGALELKRRPSNPPLAAFDPWSGGGVVQSRCESPPGQICFGQWTPAGPGRGSGIYFACKCRRTLTIIEPPSRSCQLVLDASGIFQCTGECAKGSSCGLGVWRDPNTGRYLLDCRCTMPRLVPA